MKTTLFKIIGLVLFINEFFAQTWIFNYVGNTPQNFVVPPGVCRIKIIVKGAGGGGGTCGGCHFDGGYGGDGGYVEGIFTVNAGDVLSIYVGVGGTGAQECTPNCGGGIGGWGYTIGGNGGHSPTAPFRGDLGGGGGGGGSSAVLINGSVAIVAGGGGGGGGGGACGGGGGDYGGNGGHGGGTNGGGGAAGGPAGGAPTGNGGNGMNGTGCCSSGAGGGGGGYPNGGGGGIVPACGATGGGGGGSSYCAGSACVINNGGGGTGGGQNADGANGEVRIINISPPLNLSITSQSITCYGYNDGCATAIPSGGNPPFTYTWSNGATNATNCGLGPGNYTATVIDVYGCKATNTVQIIEPTPVVPSAVTQSVSCFDFSDGSATVTATGGTGTYGYFEFQPQGGAGSNNFASYLHAGNYTVNVYDGNNCVGTTTFQIIDPPPIILSYQTKSVTCYNGSDGSATVTAIGGVGNYNYSWLPNVSNTNIINNVPYNTYTCLVTDANGCVKQINIPINQPQQVTFTFNVTPDRCHQNNGIIYSIVNGGVQPYQYLWSNGTTQYSVSGLSGNQMYTLTITDANNCVYQDTVFVPAPEPPQITSTSFTPPLCYGGKDGTAYVTHQYGTPPLYYQWVPPANGYQDSINYSVSAGTYTVYLQDYYGCLTYTTITVTQPPPIGLNVSPDQVICYGTTATLSANAFNGTLPYQYFWDTNSGFTGSGPHIVTLTTTTQYSVFAVDTNGCKSETKVINITVKPPLLAKGENITICAESSYTLEPIFTSPGNNGPYTYQWFNGVTTKTNVIVGDINNNPATYSVTISDGCSNPDAVAVFTVNVLPKPKGYFTSDFQKGCPPLKVTFNATSDGANDQYIWTLGNGNTLTGNNIIQIYEGVGTYTIGLQITNQYGCRRDTIVPDYIEVFPQPKADFEPMPSVTTIEDPIVNFSNLSNGNDFNEWNFGDMYSLNNISYELHPYHVYEMAGDYDVYLVVKNSYGCRDVIMKRIRIEPVYHLYIPNVFTPNGDGLNDVFLPKGVGIDENNYKMLIYDRWGELVYQSNNLYIGWDGSIKNKSNSATQDVYVYKIYTQDLKGNKYEYVGHVTCLPNEEK